ncbi:MAG: response regulator [Rhodospirillaceae bacterium]|jgi:two-component system, OmpR family, KDP operon response regulator KdpE|nr:response regulator [Rhodospirillaceae bacterium]MBT5240087.1 response regulator [Rhodospirillaceae bacterium]MBT5564751.1 response regulator [Rhodospirillaceae bacterium]MBT6088759.1 response regulator [Rhodospirillaceae bacterium]MBT6960596.1 response regulator [Rhodospirillaceae bacterium]
MTATKDHNGPGAKILIVDDEPQIRRFLRASLSAHDYQVVEAEDGKSAVKSCTVELPDLVVLDLGLPDVDGLDVISQIREWSQVPIVVLSIRSDESDKVDALDRGANDFVTKPFGMAELMARMRAILRHSGNSDQSGDPVIKAGNVEIDLSKRLVTVNGSPVRLSRKEYDLMRILVSHPDKVVSHQQILTEVWGPGYVEETQYLRVYIGHVRQKLEENAAEPKLFLTEPGVGYRFQTDIA